MLHIEPQRPLWTPPKGIFVPKRRAMDSWGIRPDRRATPWLNPANTYVRFPSGMTLTFIEGTASSAATITAPTTINAGDLLIMADFAINAASVPTTVVPTGFTSISNTNNTTTCKLIFSYKIADGTEDGSTITGMDGDSLDRKTIGQFRGSPAISTVTLSAIFDSGFTAGDPAIQTITASAGTPPLIVIGCAVTTSAANPLTNMSVSDGQFEASINRIQVSYKIYDTGPANVTVDVADNGDNNKGIGFYVECA